MYIPSHNRFRQDLIVAAKASKSVSAQSFIVKEPRSGETYEFGEEEFFLCQLMDGELSHAEIITRFQARFQVQLTESDFIDFAIAVFELGLLEEYQPADCPPPQAATAVDSQAAAPENPPDSPTTESTSATLTQERPAPLPPPSPPAAQRRPHPKKKQQPDRFRLFNPQPLFKGFATLFKPLSYTVWLLIPGVPLAGLTVLYNQEIFWTDLLAAAGTLPFIPSLMLNLIFINLLSKLVQGSAIARYGGSVDEFGIQLTFGFFPLFYISKDSIHQFNRKQKLWAYATPLLFRLLLAVGCILTWYTCRGSQTSLVTLSLMLAPAVIVGFLLDLNPFWYSSGYFWLVSYFRLPRLFERSWRVWEMAFTRRPLPKNLAPKEKLALLVYALAIVLCWILLAGTFIIFCAIELETNFQGTGVVLFAILIALIIRWYFTTMSTQAGHSDRNHASTQTPRYSEQPTTSNGALPSQPKAPNILKKHGLTIFAVAAGAVVLSLPYRYSPGGPIELLPPKQTEIQADISGRILDVRVEGGNGEWLEAGTVLAQIEPSRQLNPATPIPDDLTIVQEQIRSQQAIVERQQARLDKLLTSPRPEEVNVAEAALVTAKEELEAARKRLSVLEGELATANQELETAIIRADYRQREADRLDGLYKEGAISLRLAEEAEKLAETGKSEVETQQERVRVVEQRIAEQLQTIRIQQRNVEQRQANLDLVLSGPHPEEIVAARQELAAAQAALREKQEELESIKSQLQRSSFVMPFAGRIVTAELERKEGTYLQQGQTFAIAEDDRNIQGRIEVAETDVGEFNLGDEVKVKLSAYPNEILTGRVTSIEPKTVQKSTGRYLNVIVELPNTERLLKSGMTGHAKIEGKTMPIIVVFTRPIVRFIQIEIWSWIP